MEVEKLLDNLAADTENVRRAALDSLYSLPPRQLLPGVAELLLTSESADVCADCLDLLDRCEASVSLADVRMDGWFEQISKRVNNLAEISSVMGERFLAYSFILNVQIRSLMVDPMSPSNSAVHFVVDESNMQALSLGEFKLRIVQALLHETKLPIVPTLPFSKDAALAVLTGRTLLTAPLFGISLDRVILADATPKAPKYLVTYIAEDKFHVQTLPDFEEKIRGLLRRDLAGMAEEPFSLDLFAVAKAREAARNGNTLLVIDALEAWPGLLSMLFRTAAFRSLDEEQLALIGEGAALLGEALEKEDRNEWAEELYKLGLQFVRESKEASRLMTDLGRRLVRTERFGESIGLLRRALQLGAPETEVLPLLGRAFLKQEKYTAARALLERCKMSGFEGPNLEEDLTDVKKLFDELGVAWDVPYEEAAATA